MKKFFAVQLFWLVLAGHLCAFTYDSAGRLSSVARADGSRIVYNFDAAGNITAMTVTPGNNTTPALTSEIAMVGEVGVGFAEVLRSNKASTTFSASGLPAGLKLKISTGEISGTPTMAGVSQVAMTLTAAGQTGNATISIQIRPAVEISWTSFVGNYAGTTLAEPPTSCAGTATVTITKGGSFSAVFFFKGQRISLSGTFSATGAFSGTISRPGASDLQVKLALSRVNQSVTGTVGDGTTVATIDTNRERSIGELKTWQVGPWTFLLKPKSSNPGAAPNGSGYGIITVGKTGKGTFAGSLADGQKVSGGVVFNNENGATFFQSLYTGKGFVAGSLSLDGAPVMTGEFFWSHPALPGDKYFKEAFEASLTMKGSRFSSRPAGTRIVEFASVTNNAKLTVGEGSLAKPIAKIFTLDLMNKGVFEAPNVEKLSLSISKVGIISGSFLETDSNKLIKFGGAILQEQRVGSGYFLGDPVSGLVELAPNP